MSVCPVFVGRSAELAVLDAALRDGGGVFLVAGEAGIGKSRLLREFAARASAPRRAVLWARPEAMTRPGPFSVVIDMLDALAHLGSEPNDEARRMSDELEGLADGAETPVRQIAARLRGLLSSVGRQRVVLVEDLHHADELSQAVLAHLARSARDDATLIVASYRIEESGRDPLARLLDLLTRDRLATQLDLHPLDHDATGEMLAAMWGSPPDEETLAAIEKLGEGIPFFVEELAAARIAGAGSVPQSIARAVLTRVQQLPDEARGVIEVAALISGSIDPGVLADACGVPDGAIPPVLIDALRAGLLTDDDGRLGFRHALVREAIASTVTSLERSATHARIAGAIERRHADALDAHARALAEHHAAAGARDAAARFSVVEGKRALAAGALDEARAAFVRAVESGASELVTLPALPGLAEVHIRTAAFADAEVALRGAAEKYRALGDRPAAARVLSRLAWVVAYRFERDALPLWDEALGFVSPDDEAYASIQLDKGFALARIFADPDAARPIIDEAAARADALDEPVLRARAHDARAWIAHLSGDLEAADRDGREACAIIDTTEATDLIARLHHDRAVRSMMTGNGADALETLETARARFINMYSTHHLHALDDVRAMALWRLGRPADALQAATALEATSYARKFSGVARAWADVEMGDAARAATFVRAWWAELGDDAYREHVIADPASVQGTAPSEVFAILAEAIVRVHSGAIDDEALRLLQIYDDFCRGGYPDTRFLVTLLHARALIGAGDAKRADVVLADAEDGLASSPQRYHVATTLELRAALAAEPIEAVDGFEKAAAMHAESHNVLDQVRCIRLAAEARAAGGEGKDDLGGTLKDARELAANAGAVAEVNRLEGFMRTIGMRPRAGRPKGPRREPGTLSAREQEVVALVAAGATNAEISRRLFLSERTVEDHVAGAQRRLGLAGRASLAAWAAKNGLV